MSPLLEARAVSRVFRRGRLRLTAVDAVSIAIGEGETVGLVGESGCGKSTLGRLLAGLDAPTEGTVLFAGEAVETRDGAAFRDRRRQLQMVFQHPLQALNPRRSAGAHVAEVARAHRLAASAGEAREMAASALAEVGIDGDLAGRYPHQLSGGQRQRVLLARALVLRPAFVVFDEPTSALDLSVQAQVLELIARLRDRFGLTAAFISHDLRVVRAMADRIAVMYLGEVVEIGPAGAVTRQPHHPYAKALLGAVLSLDPDAAPPVPLAGDPPDPAETVPGCRFSPRCPRAADPCIRTRPLRLPLPHGREVACHAVAADLAGRPWPGDGRASAA